MALESEFQQARGIIDASSDIILTMHERMDGDDGGSLLAMREHLTAAGKRVTCVIKRGVPPQLKFLPNHHEIQDDADRNDFDLLITFGCATLDRTGSSAIAGLSCPILNFDHHPDNSYFGKVNVVDKRKSSVAELVYDFFTWHQIPITKNMAVCLLTGIITDTGSFMHSNTSASTLKAAAELTKRGALADKIIKETFKNKTPQILRAWGRAIENSYYDAEHKIIYSVVTEDDLHDLGQLPPAAFEGFAETLNTVPEAKFVMFLRQDGNLIKGSLRTDSFKNVDVAAIAKAFGGGGHKQAAGFSVAGKLVKDENGMWRAQ